MTTMTKSHIFTLLLAMFFIGIAAGCAFQPGQSLPTPWPTEYIPTVIAMTAAALPTPSPTATDVPVPTNTPEPTATEEQATLPPLDPTFFFFLSVTPIPATPTPDLSRTAIEFDSPGEMSKVVSPIELRGYISPDVVGTTSIELIGEDGRTITRIVKKTESAYFQYARVAISVPFEIRSGGELARLQIKTEDKKGNITGLNSVYVLLLSLGTKDITLPPSTKEACLLTSPLPNVSVSGNALKVEGEMRPFNDESVIFELVDLNGKVLGNRVLVFKPADGTYQKFNTTVPFNVRQTTPARLVVHQADSRIDGLRYVFSRPVTLSP
jgi:hypothetical protein